MLHRDVKPENILLPDGRTDVKVLDFGIAKLVGDTNAVEQEDTLTAAGMPIGTPAYMAPEQLAGETVTPQTDLFSLGVLAFELVTVSCRSAADRCSRSRNGSSAATRRRV